MKMYMVNDTNLTASGWAERMGISRQAMASRIRKAKTGSELEEALTTSGRQGFRSDRVELTEVKK